MARAGWVAHTGRHPHPDEPLKPGLPPTLSVTPGAQLALLDMLLDRLVH